MSNILDLDPKPLNFLGDSAKHWPKTEFGADPGSKLQSERTTHHLHDKGTVRQCK